MENSMKKNIFKSLAFTICALTNTYSEAMMNRACFKLNEARHLVTSFLKRTSATYAFQKQTFTIKNNEQLNVLPINSDTQNKKEEIQTLNDAFDYESFNKFHIEKFKWIRAELETPQGPLFAGVALYKELSEKEIRLSYLAIPPSQQSKGIGKALIEFIAANTQCQKMILYSEDSAVPFYHKLGFKTDCGNYLSKNFTQPAK